MVRMAETMTQILGSLAPPIGIMFLVGALFVIPDDSRVEGGGEGAVGWVQSVLFRAITDHRRAQIRLNTSEGGSASLPALLPCCAQQSEANAGDT
jgi:hypothetical protein